MERGRFISVEGIEGVGKTSNINALVEFVEKLGYAVVTTREPGGTALAEDIRQLLMHRGDEPIPEIAELLLMFAARSLNVNNTIKPALERGAWVVCDRFTDSSRAYQGGGRGLEMATVNQLAEWVHGDLWPDLTILLDAPVELALARAGQRSEPDRIEKEKQPFFGRVRDCYLKLAEQEPERFAVVDTTRPLDEVTADVLSLAQGLADQVID